ncbi:hypothetical protein M2182_003044 [Bradyrhizobium japonicum]|uniref:hypothetical protein n=1 Tax=Bradyrhizobium japonicum TaxID=375 RepID=UPI0020A0E545|nr:hypothetical protein [Bradyrhizobium japonicum]MCS4024379.1 hypothetical protein [Bradyrhizobium japonicum]
MERRHEPDQRLGKIGRFLRCQRDKFDRIGFDNFQRGQLARRIAGKGVERL